MENDDDMIVVIVGDEDEYEDVENTASIIKSEVDDEDCKFSIENLIGAAQTFGEEVSLDDILIKEEPQDYEYLDENIIKTEVDFECDDVMDYIPEEDDNTHNFPEDDDNSLNFLDDDTDYVPEDDEEDVVDEVSDIEPKKKRRYTMIKPWLQKSFVKELRQQYPELVNKKKLIKTLSGIMKMIKPPPPPLDYYILNGIMLECLYCHRLSETIPAAARHYQEKHGPRYLICYACGADFRSTTNLYKHEKRCNAADAGVVLQARSLCLGRSGGKRPHPSGLSPLSPHKYSCDLCSAEFVTRSNLQSHEYMHFGLRPFRCDSCPAQYTSRSALSRHVKKHSGVRYECAQCGRAFTAKGALVTHLHTHGTSKRFVCELCGKQFAQKFALQLHADSRHRRLPPPCACHLCPKRFRRKSVLKEHMKRAHGMDLITRKMFFKTLPQLTETQLKHAKVVLKSEEAMLAARPLTDA
ncbi:zinc finger protein 674 [Papilio machaon]|uniref:zinc finger protein 674 n=1 Tax=Papilio machaon TaxID=76193 RepID=UPI001E6645F3|nr:zinc finger protein 674 [Papilio machaon]XP_045536552.1 zinc finger protein 674 [Papilio machaon]XP_045536553.1 zinc finger protein 674 [Papilio machaon]